MFKLEPAQRLEDPRCSELRQHRLAGVLQLAAAADAEVAAGRPDAPGAWHDAAVGRDTVAGNRAGNEAAIGRDTVPPGGEPDDLAHARRLPTGPSLAA